MNVFISGGCKNGKSHHAQNIAKTMADEKNLPLYYLATMIPKDEEASTEGFDFTEVYCLGCSWHGSPKRLIKF